ncbi:nuclear pore complex protein Nup98-Nup96 [Daktulosphaira vitifoliae]|uniref:nuclear pore complex protein Nup98-Nup96 n=1 Tax=Daktulosphaira vitifoliae TaxID=58002 RepID=UPI0021A98DEA|nr:nuclear pore complex protein Nup98-Nup96 [Daktulosphaira vitifoliae]
MFGSGSGAFSGGAGNSSAFGQSTFGKPAGTSVFGQSNTSIFNQTTQPNTGLFGSTAAAPAFGQTPAAQQTFGGFSTGGTSLFGTPTATPASSSSLFGQQNASMVGNTGGSLFGSSNPNASFGQPKPVNTGFSFGSTVQPSGNIFGTPQGSSTGSGIFGVPSAGTFGATSGFGNAQVSTGGTTIKFNPVTGTDTMVKNGTNQTINTRHQSITVMKEYESKIFEELRFEDYCANRKVGQQGTVGGGLFGAPKTLFGSTATTSTGLFGSNDNKPLFGATSTTPALGGFGSTSTSSVFGAQNNIFGKTQQTAPTFGTTTSTSSFGMNTTQPSIFGANTAQTSKPFGVGAPQTNIFGSTAPTAFGPSTTGFGQTGFGAQPNQNNLFSQNKSAFGLGSTPSSTSFGFGTNTSTSASGGGLFGNKQASTGFQLPTPAFGSTNTFGATSTAQPATGGLFGSNAFNKPQTSLFNQPNNTQTNVFSSAAKPGGLFGQGTQSTGLFGSANNSSFGTGGTSFFGSSQQPGSGIGLFSGSTNTQLTPNQSSQNNQIQLQLETLKAMPYGDSPLFKRFYKDVTKVDESSVVRSQNVSLDKFSSYKVSPIPTPKSLPQVRRNFPQFNRKSLFDGLEESPPSFKTNDKTSDGSILVSSPRTNYKKLNLKKDSDNKLKSSNSLILHTKPLAKLENYFIAKQGSLLDNTRKVDLSINDSNNTVAELHSNKKTSPNSSKGVEIIDIVQNNVTEIDNKEPSIDPNIPEAEDHCTGIKLRRVGYYTIPPMNELAELVDDNGACYVDGFTIGRYDFGNVFFPDRINVAGLDLDSIVHIRHREVIIYQDDENKPPLGEGLNRKATVTLDRVWPTDKTTKQPITCPDRIAATNFVAKLQRVCGKLNAHFVDYRLDSGSWVFSVDHFSKYALLDSDEDDDNIEVTNIDPNKIQPKSIPQKPKIGKLVVENGSPNQLVANKQMLDLTVGLDRSQLPHQYLMKSNNQPMTIDSLTLNDDPSVMHFYDNNKENSVNVTAQLSQNMNLQAHKIQCMKASFNDIFYDEIEPMDQDEDSYDEKNKFEHKLEKILETLPDFIASPNKNDTSLSKSTVIISNNQAPASFFITKQKRKIGQSTHTPKLNLMAPLQAKRYSLKYDASVRIPFEEEFKNIHKSNKLALLKSVFFKVPWSNNLTFVTINTKSKQNFLQSKKLDISCLSTDLSGRVNDDYSSTIIQKIKIMTPTQTETFLELLTEHLQICMEHSNFDTENSTPFFYPKSGVDGLHSHCCLLAHFSELPEETLYSHVWELIKALWGDPENLFTKDCPQEHLYNMARRQAISDWLEALLEKTIDFKNSDDNTSQKILKLVSAHKIMEACDLAISDNDCNLAMLLAQLGSENSVRCCIQRQLWQWSNSKADLFIDNDHLKLYTMVAGQPLYDSSKGIINICENMDWVRAFALHLWYIQPPSGTIEDALNAYQNAFDGDDSYACMPFSKNYLNHESPDDIFSTFDVCFHLMKLYTNSTYDIYEIVNPLTHTRDPLDYNFSWLLFNTLQSLGYTQMYEPYCNQLHINFASQLSSHGLWHWAIFVLLHIKDNELRENLIEDMIGRNVENTIELNDKEAFIVSKLHVKETIIYYAKAILTESQKMYHEAVTCYLKAECWQEANDVLVGNLLSYYILQRDGKPKLKHLLNWLIDGCKVEGIVPTPMQDSLTILEYLKLNENLNSMSADKLISHVVSLCERVAGFSEKTVEERMIKTEVSTSIAQQIGHIISKLDLPNRKMLKSLILPLNKLTLTEDYSLDEIVQTITHLL